MAALTVFECAACGHREFPRPLLCPACGGMQFVAADAGRGRVEEVTALHRRSADGDELAWLATVLTGAGPRVIARLDDAPGQGAVVALRIDADGAIRAEPV
ncbi:hypothetical protein [Paraburkholderia caballeronis]|uniref:DUF35 domain-containing protein n=1 Tax=Paraburkholderia caballeronis TaxID=416943 RepID=A0A1H7J7V3_9BURK|nr:hypothetical protein [Paraburkholderia caballeronis]PXW27536.1 hypothetical protein C7403_103450 [Paraburkholderia caballeronis]PXX03010.1 hypothetical protein C7407_103450 [Paraburkholderia caballeronis]RAK03735.1 hypothetical protein C7409_103450 [Paraburkholderia caballeronis]TDV21093.1 hypothetical protein C7408_101612 [Paraburkholderia caballeronis]TDV21522.1 hypothetical protein C7406_102422 [Paraburkholderia caballeronis]